MPFGLVPTPEALGDETITLYVGESKKKYIMHKKILCDKSSFFSKVFAGGFEEASAGVIDLPEDDIDAVTALVDFLYRGTIPSSPSEDGPKYEEDAGEYIKLMVKAYCLAEEYCMNEFMNRLFDGLRGFPNSAYTSFTNPSEVQNIYENTHEKIHLRRYVAAGFVYRLTSKSYNAAKIDTIKEICKVVPDLLGDILQAQVDYNKRTKVRRYDHRRSHEEFSFGACEFHVHESAEAFHLAEESTMQFS